jgi:tRNA pseudouridine55 synthase
MFSAIKRGRRRLHELARAGQVVEREPRPIVVHRLELVEFASPRVRFEVVCSKGTYIRSLVADLGADLGCGAHVTALRRTRSGPFSLDRAVRIDDLSPAVAAAALVRMADILPLPRVTVPVELTFAVTQARGGLLAPLAGDPRDGERFQLVAPDGDLLAVCAWRGDQLRFERVFCSPELLARRGA